MQAKIPDSELPWFKEFIKLCEYLRDIASKETHYHNLNEWSDYVFGFIHKQLKRTGFISGNAYHDSNNDEQALEEKRKANMLEEFLPQLMNENETRELIEFVIRSMDSPNMGKVMKEISLYKPKLNMKLASQIVKENL